MNRNPFRITLVLLVALGTFSVDAAEPGTYASAVAIKPLLKTEVDGTGRPIAYPVTANPEVTVVHVEIPPGAQTNWHKHPVPCFAYMLSGELQIELADGTTKIVKGGEAFAEVVDVLHNGTNRGREPARLVMFVVGTTGQPYAVRPPATAAPAGTPANASGAAPVKR